MDGLHDVPGGDARGGGSRVVQATEEEQAAIRAMLSKRAEFAPAEAAAGRAPALAWAGLRLAAAVLLAAGVVAGYADGDEFNDVGCTVAQQPGGTSHGARSAQAREGAGGKVPGSDGASAGPSGTGGAAGRPECEARAENCANRMADGLCRISRRTCRLLEMQKEERRMQSEDVIHMLGETPRNVAALPAVLAGGSPQAIATGAVCLIRQESVRRRGGKHDRTEVSTWRIWFRGWEVLMPTWVGAEYLVFLFRNQPREFDAGALTQAIRKNRSAAAGGSGQTAREILYGHEAAEAGGEPAAGRVGDLNERDVIWDERQIADALRNLKGLEEEIRLHEAAGDLSSERYQESKAKLEERQELLAASAKQVDGKWVPKEYQKGTFQEKADVIRKHIRKLLDGYLRENCRPLFDHLNDRNTLVYGVNNCYHPTPRIEWEFQFKGRKKGT